MNHVRKHANLNAWRRKARVACYPIGGVAKTAGDRRPPPVLASTARAAPRSSRGSSIILNACSTLHVPVIKTGDDNGAIWQVQHRARSEQANELACSACHLLPSTCSQWQRQYRSAGLSDIQRDRGFNVAHRPAGFEGFVRWSKIFQHRIERIMEQGVRGLSIGKRTAGLGLLIDATSTQPSIS